MNITDPRSGKEYHYYYTAPPVPVERGTKLRCGNAFYLNFEEQVRNFAEFWKLRTVE